MEKMKMIQILDLLLDKTKKKEVLWQRVSIDSEEFKLELKTCNLIMIKRHDDFLDFNFQLAIHNKDGELIEEQSSKRNNDSEVSDLIIELYSEARRSFFKTDEVINAIINKIKTSIIIGEKKESDGNLFF